MSARALVVGLDGADLDLIQTLGAARLPHLFSLMERGAYAALRSVLPPATLPNWTTFLTTLDPGRHGVIDFTTRDARGRVHFSAGTVREAPTIATRLDRLGARCAVMGFPATWPPEPLEHGIFMSGWDSPVAFEADASFVHPRALYAEIQARFGDVRFDDVDEMRAETPGWHEALAPKLIARVERKLALYQWILARERWELAAFYFGESDTASHHLWSLYDEGSPRHRSGAPEGLPRVYEALDAALGTLVEAAGPDAEITVLSDHGSGGASDRVLYLNRVLAEGGLLSFRPAARAINALSGQLKSFALTKLSPKLRERVFRLGGAALPSLLETQARFGAIEMSQTDAYSDELNYFPGIWLSERGERDRAVIEARLKEVLFGLRDPFDGQRVVEHVWPREALFEGPFLDRAPHFLLGLRRIPFGEGGRDYSYNVMPSASAPPSCAGSFRLLTPEEHLGRKGRSLPGSHRDRGFMAIAGPSVQPAGLIDAHIADIGTTLLYRLGVEPVPESLGRVLFEACFIDKTGRTRPSPKAELPASAPAPHADLSIVERRLRALGYID